MNTVAFDPVRLIPLHTAKLSEKESEDYIFNALGAFVKKFIASHKYLPLSDFNSQEVSRTLNEFVDSFIKELDSSYRIDPKLYKNVANSLEILNITSSDTRFPFFFSSLADHMISTSAVALASALHFFSSGIDFSKEYNGYTAKLLAEKDGLKAFVRFVAMFHDLGKPHLEKHEERSASLVKYIILDNIFVGDKFNCLKTDITNAIKRHHYSAMHEPPTTKLEWVIAFADKVSASDRSLPLRKEVMLNFIEMLRNESIEEDSINKLEFLLRSESKGVYKDRYESVRYLLRGFLSPNPEDLISDKKLINAEKEIIGREDKPISILVIEIGSKQQLITRTGALKDLQGASLLIDAAIKIMSETIEELLGPESILINDAGELIAIVPSSAAEDILNKCVASVPKFIRKSLVFKSNVTSHCFFKLAELKYGPEKLWNLDTEGLDQDYVNSLITRDTYRSFGSVMSYAMESLLPISELNEKNSESIDSFPISKSCKVCGSESSVDSVDEWIRSTLSELGHPSSEKIEEIKDYLLTEVENALICHKCLATRFVSYLFKHRKDTTMKDVIERIKLNKTRAFSLVQDFERDSSVYLKFISSLDDFNEDYKKREKEINALIALVHGDGDNFGLVKSSASTIAQYRYLTRLFNSLIENALKEGFKQSCKIKARDLNLVVSNVEPNYLPFLPIYSGGDDFLVILEAPYLFVFLKAFRKKVQEIAGVAREKYLKVKITDPLSTSYLGISMGVSVADVKQPLYALYTSSKGLENISKNKLSKPILQRRLKYGSEISVSLFYFRNFVGSFDIDKTVWPLSGEALFDKPQKSFTYIIHKVFVDGNVTSNDLKPYVYLLKSKELPEFITLKLLYDYSRVNEKKAKTKEDKKEKEGLESLAENYFIEIDESGKNKHTTILSLLDVYDIIVKHFRGIVEDEDMYELIKVMIP
ncbi:MAG: Cas10/Cmr2 second palm domain-containing protein [Thermoproteota archaeon]